jgi:hypothetical protein
MGEFSIQTQVQLVLGLLGLFNFIRQKEGVEAEFDDDIEEGVGDLNPIRSSQGNKAMNEFRDKIAQEMWISYCQYIGREP